ncbi:ABC transporter permease [Alicyclobacillus mengziensis]|uniref:ABC transporter permease n=1 Tax=Alicyclobacillus mengziensis TaxID=2931921 RepID=A0A9X7VWM5_9BACL|nr:ABC transporter permease [Alicyclobacillus mengziensis]QSO46436.1 ABC transporter permease [Alicyclobacillus mengziensis]
MGTYITRRLLGMIPMLFFITVAVFLMMHAAPGNAFNSILNPNIQDPQALIASLEKQNGLDKPLWWQYIHWVSLFVTGNWGFSFAEHQPVIDLVAPALRNTLILSITAEILTLGIGIPLGVFQSRKPYSAFDYSTSVVSFILFSVPYFIFAILLIYVFAIHLRIFPAQGAVGTGPGAGSLLDHIYHALLPAIAIALSYLAFYSRNTRGSMLEVSRKDYVRTAYAKGLNSSTVFSKHVLRNALIPLITFFGLDIGNLVGGAVILEGLFTYQGMGLLTISAVNNRDYNVIMATTIIFAIAVLLGNLLADILYAVVDPRIRYN